MPYNKVMAKYKAGSLHSGSKRGPVVKSRSQAIAIMLSEKRAASAGKAEYKPTREAKNIGELMGTRARKAKRLK